MTDGKLPPRFKASIPSGAVAPDEWRSRRITSVGTLAAMRARREAEEPEPGTDLEFEPCRNERCWIETVHQSHEADFPSRGTPRQRPKTGRRRGRPTQHPEATDDDRDPQPVRLGVGNRRRVLRIEDRPDGPMAIVACSPCDGADCEACLGRSEMTMISWWRLKNGG